MPGALAGAALLGAAGGDARKALESCEPALAYSLFWPKAIETEIYGVMLGVAEKSSPVRPEGAKGGE